MTRDLKNDKTRPALAPDIQRHLGQQLASAKTFQLVPLDTKMGKLPDSVAYVSVDPATPLVDCNLEDNVLTVTVLAAHPRGPFSTEYLPEGFFYRTKLTLNCSELLTPEHLRQVRDLLRRFGIPMLTQTWLLDNNALARERTAEHQAWLYHGLNTMLRAKLFTDCKFLKTDVVTYMETDNADALLVQFIARHGRYNLADFLNGQPNHST